jgi:phenylpropionate dioxygenase-like ring-hydroxylating dioxygenase large terminal subunit
LLERTLWHPVALAREVGSEPCAVELLATRLVLWRDGAGTVRAFDDRCPHRGARFSLGLVQEGALECPYHGWRFDGSGRAIGIPAIPGYSPPETHRATVHETRERHGLVWVRLDRTDRDEGLPAFPAEDDARLRKLSCGPYAVAASAPRIVENFLDMARFGFVHEGGLGSRMHTAVADYRVETTPTGFVATGCKAWQPQSSVHAQGGAVVEYTYEVNAPYTSVLTKMPEAGAVQIEDFREAIALFVCPVTPEASRVWFRVAMNDFESSDEKLSAFQDTIFAQDRPILESQEPKRLPISDAAPVQELHSAADRSASAYRRYLRQRGITFGVC